MTGKTGEAGSRIRTRRRKRDAGVAIKDLATEDPDLEDVFMSLTYDGGADPTQG